MNKPTTPFDIQTASAPLGTPVSTDFIDPEQVRFRRDDPNKPLYDIIFSPDVDGFPSTDFGVNAEHMSDPSLARFVNEKLHRRVEGDAPSFDDNQVMASIKSRFETVDHYKERMTKYIDSKKTEKDSNLEE